RMSRRRHPPRGNKRFPGGRPVHWPSLRRRPSFLNPPSLPRRIFFDTLTLDAREPDAHSAGVLEIGGRPGAGARVAERVVPRGQAGGRTRYRKGSIRLAGGNAAVPAAERSLWEVRSSLPSKREARVFIGFHEGVLVALHAIIKKGRKAPA